ncbi:helix-turn-helix domain-containing protein [Flavobacterium sp.]|uniref:helix-turn-helix domain-containing protein n=1 Tax=Flavobacterium sp. TaxID=239 RepID=UPI003752E4B1
MRTTIYFLLLFITNIAFSQSKFVLTDQEYQKLHDKSRLLINSNVDSSFVYANKIEKSNNPLHKAFAYGIKSYLYQLKGDSIKSKQLYKQAFTYLNKIPQSVEKTKHHSYLLAYGGLAESVRGNLSDALLKYEEGKKIAISTNDFLQVIKFSNNFASLYGDAGNYKLAIKEARISDKIIDKYQFEISKEKYENNKSNVNICLGNFYESLHHLNLDKKSLDSSKYFYAKAISFSEKLVSNRISAKCGLGNIYCLKNNYPEAIKTYLSLFVDLKENNQKLENAQIYYNTGISYYNMKNYDEASVYFAKSDSIYQINKFNISQYLDSNYYQAKIYEIKNDPAKALLHAKIYLDNFELNEIKKSNKKNEINSILGKKDIEREMIKIREKYRKQALLESFFKWGGIAVIFTLIIVLLINLRNKKVNDGKFKNLLLEFESITNKQELNKDDYSNGVSSDIEKSKKSGLFNLDEEKEKELLQKLSKQIDKKEFLKEGFTLLYVANKIKTNTTYLSYVVNKEFEKSFSDYANELKINYAINEMINNPTYRKYSTQAIAESVGFKNAISFTKSFNKRAGVTPAQFIKRIDH